jgi:hypothetical protein
MKYFSQASESEIRNVGNHPAMPERGMLTAGARVAVVRLDMSHTGDGMDGARLHLQIICVLMLSLATLLDDIVGCGVMV